MTDRNIRSEPLVSDYLHSTVYHAIVGLTIWLVLSAWAFALGGGYVDLALGVVSLFFLIALAIPFALWRAWRKERGFNAADGDQSSFRDWASGEFETWQGRLKGTDAALQVLLPIAAVSFGMTAFAIIYLVVKDAA